MNLLSTTSYQSRRSPVVGRRGVVASSQPLASLAGVTVLEQGGSAADAAVATAAALQVTQPCSTGLGGDVFMLYREAESGEVHALNGSGRSAAALTHERAAAVATSRGGIDEQLRLPALHPDTVTVPGAPAAWADTLARFGRLKRAAVMEPAIRLARDGFPVAPLTAAWWSRGAERQLSTHRYGSELMIDGRGPRPGEVFRNPGLARVLADFADEGSAPFYHGWIAQAVVAEMEHEGGALSAADLAAHQSEWVEPISTSYHGSRLWECPPNGQGLIALLALGILGRLEARWGIAAGQSHPDAVLLHAMAEALRQAFAAGRLAIGEPGAHAGWRDLLSDAALDEMSAGLSPDRSRAPAGPSVRAAGTDTVYLCAVDRWGNSCSFINSNFMGFGTGIVPRHCGYTLQNRGHGFVLEPGLPNSIAPGCRPYHTIIPGMLTPEAGTGLTSPLGVMGGMMQPQGHLQVVRALCADALDPQAALDRARIQLADGRPDGAVLCEAEDDAVALSARGHAVHVVPPESRPAFGLGQVILQTAESNWGGSDPRGDGLALAEG